MLFDPGTSNDRSQIIPDRMITSYEQHRWRKIRSSPTTASGAGNYTQKGSPPACCCLFPTSVCLLSCLVLKYTCDVWTLYGENCLHVVGKSGKNAVFALSC